MSVISTSATPSWSIRDALEDDLPAMLSLYSHYVLHSSASAEYEVPSMTEWRSRFLPKIRTMPFLVACDRDGVLLGYAYAGAFNTRSGYRWVCETTIYTSAAELARSPPRRESTREGGRSLGTALYETLLSQTERMGFRHAIAILHGDNARSLAFHRRMGFVECARFRGICYKFGKWADIVHMQRRFDRNSDVIPPVPSMQQLKQRSQVSKL